MILYHRTNRDTARIILRHGFRDTVGSYMVQMATRGVWVSETPLSLNEGADGDMLFRIILPGGESALRRWAWVEHGGKPYREWQVPAALLNKHRRRLVHHLIPVDR